MTTTQDVEPIRTPLALGDLPKLYAQPPAETLAKLPKPYSKDNPKGSCSECGGFHGLPALHLDYLGHADLTLILLAIDPDWNWEPAAVNPETGGPAISREGNRLVMWATLTLLGKTMRGVGTCAANKDDPEKELIGDFLRNAAMRYGIGTKLWSKVKDGQSADPFGSGESGGYEPRRASTTQQPQRIANGQGRPAPARNTASAPPVPDYVMALAGAKDKNPAYILSIARPIARKHGQPEPRIPNEMSPELAATVADRIGVDVASIGLDPALVWPHMSDAQPAPPAEPPVTVDTFTDPEPVPLNLPLDAYPGPLHVPGCTCEDRDRPCLEEPF